MADSPTIIAASLSDSELKNSVNSLVKHVNEAMQSMVGATNSAVDAMEKKLKSLGDLKIDSGGTADGGASRRAKAQNEETASVKESTQAYKAKEATLDQQSSAINTAIRSEKKYTEEIQKQAAAIRATKEWQERGNVIIGDKNYYDPERQNVSKRQKAELLTLEEQILQVQQKEAQASLVAAEAKRQQAQAAKEAASVSRPTPIYDIPNVGYYQMYEDSKRILHGGTANTSGMQKSAQEAQYLREQIAGLLEVNEKEIKVANTASASYNQLAQYLKQLQSAYNRLGTDRIAKSEGTDLANEIQRVQRAMQKLQQTMSRPISLNDALKLPEKTLDDMAYKMRQLSAYRSGLDVDKQKNEIEQVNKAYTSLQKQMNEVMQKNESLIGSNTALLRSWNYMKNRLAFYVTVGAGTQLVRNLIEVRSQYEMNERALGILIDSAERGTQIFNELSQMALVSPYTLIELSTAAKQLTAYDVAAKDVVDTTRRLADMAAAVGIPIERLTYALGQIKAYGYLNSRDARMFANAGIPLVKQLSDYYTELEGKLVSTADVYDRIKKKAIDYNEVMEVVNKMTDEGGKFFDFQAKMADTLKVRLANLTLAWNNMLNDIGKSSQGMLTWGIGALRELFLHWKDLDNALTNAGWALGIRTALMFIVWSALKAGNALGVMGKQMALSAVFGTKLANVLKNVGYSVIALAKNKWTWISLFAVAAVEASKALLGVNEAQKALNESIRNGAKDNYNNIKKFSEQYQEVRDSLYKSNGAGGRAPVDIDNNEAKKVWEAIREQIELTVSSSEEYIGKLLSIENMSERVRQGFDLLDDVQVVNAALKELGDDTIAVSQDWDTLFHSAILPEGFISDLKDVIEEENSLIEKFGSLSAAQKKANDGNVNAETSLSDYNAALKEFRSELEETTQSILNFIQVKGWSGDEGKINQVFSQIGQKIILDNQLDPQKAFQLQIELEEARSKAAKQALLRRIKDEKAAYKASLDESVRQALNADVKRFNSWSETNGRSKVEWERFTKWLKEQHISETTAMFRNMDAEDIKSLNFQEGKHAEWVTRMVTQYAKEHKMSYDEAFNYLKSWVKSANQWSIFIPLTISSEDKKSVYEQLGEYDKAVDEADAQIERLTKRIGELNAKKKKSKEETQELTRAEEELTRAQTDKADAEAKGGHGKKEKKDDKANAKAQKAAESELQKALKEELQLIDKVRSTYKALTKDGVGSQRAIAVATSGFSESVANINKVLGKYGISKLDLTKYAGVQNPRAIMDMLQSQLDKLMKSGVAKPSEIKDLQVKLKDLQVESISFDQKTIADSLNNELGKLKDEYELAVELDADPEMGNLFAEMWGINTEALPRTAKEYAERMTTEVNKYLKENKAGVELPNLLNVTDDDMKAFRDMVKAGTLNEAVFKEIEKNVKVARDAREKEFSDTVKGWDNLLQKYAEYEYKQSQIQKQANQERKAFAMQFGREEQKSQAKALVTQIDAEKDPQKKAELIKTLQNLVKEIAGDDSTKINLVTAIDNRALEESAKLAFEEFKKSPDWIIATGDLAGLTDKALKRLITQIEDYKKKAKNLNPKQIKEINRALRALHKQVREGNPFAAIVDVIEQAEERAEEYQPELDSIMSDIISLEKEIGDNDPTEEQAKHLKTLKDKWLAVKKAQEETGKVDAKQLTSAINDSIQAASQATKVFTDMMDAIAGEGNNASQTIKDISSVLEKGGQGAAIGAQIGGGYGAIIGGVAGVVTGLVSVFAGASNRRITEKVEESERAVKRLENRVESLKGTYDAMTDAAEHSYGAQSAAATLAASSMKEQEIALKRLMLSETRRQLRLEQSRDSKDRDDDKILSLQKDIISQQNEIDSMLRETSRAVDEVVDSLLGISRSSWAEELTDALISAFKAGEDYMDVFEDSWEEMVQNMVVKTIAARVIGDALEKNVLSRIEQIENEATAPYRQQQADLTQHKANLQNLRLENENQWYDTISQYQEFPQVLAKLGEDAMSYFTDEKILYRAYNRAFGMHDPFLEKYGDQLEQELFKIYDNYNTGIEGTLNQAQQTAQERALREVMTDEGGVATKEALMQSVSGILPDMMKTWGIQFGQDADKTLSALQQGISGITEQQAGALEGYMNGVSQQVYLQSDILQQINTAVQSFNFDAQLGTLSQILLQLQTTYQNQQAIRSIMEGWTNASGMAVRVEMV